MSYNFKKNSFLNIKGDACAATIFVISLIAGAFFACVSQRLTDPSFYSDNIKYNEVCWLTAHNAFAYANPSFSNWFLLPPNQILNINQQLEFGVKSFMIDLYYQLDQNNNRTSQINIAHSSGDNPNNTRFFEQPLAPFLTTIKDWLDSHHQDIITLHLESYIRDYKLIKQHLDAAGLTPYLFDPGNNSEWPTLKEMRDNNTRLVIFSDNSQDIGPGILYTNRYLETQYDLEKYHKCEMRRDNRANPDNSIAHNKSNGVLLVMNNFYPLSIPVMGLTYSEANSAITGHISLLRYSQDEYEKMMTRICLCHKKFDQFPNFIAVDHVGLSDAPVDLVINLSTKYTQCGPFNIENKFHRIIPSSTRTD